jgi:hypothetical protein
MSSHAPGTLFRSYNADRSAHNTAVLLKDGRVLELKNADGSPKKTQESYAAWLAERGVVADAVETDTTKATGIVISNTDQPHGFHVNLKEMPQYGSLTWPVWCYRVIAEAAPSLLENAAVRTAFNNLADICEKHKAELSYARHHTKDDFYNPTYLKYREDLPMKGMDVHFYWESVAQQRNGWTREMYAAAKEEIGAAYTVLYELIAPQVRPFLEKKHGLIEATKKLKDAKSWLTHYDKKERELHYKESYALRTYQYKMDRIKKEKEYAARRKAEYESAYAAALNKITTLKS